MGARTQGCASMCTRWATDKPHLCSRENLPQMGGSTSPAICSYIWCLHHAAGSRILVSRSSTEARTQGCTSACTLLSLTYLPYRSVDRWVGTLGRNWIGSGTHTYIHTYLHTYMCVCVFVCKANCVAFMPYDMVTFRHFRAYRYDDTSLLTDIHLYSLCSFLLLPPFCAHISFHVHWTLYICVL